MAPAISFGQGHLESLGCRCMNTALRGQLRVRKDKLLRVRCSGRLRSAPQGDPSGSTALSLFTGGERVGGRKGEEEEGGEGVWEGRDRRLSQGVGDSANLTVFFFFLISIKFIGVTSVDVIVQVSSVQVYGTSST